LVLIHLWKKLEEITALDRQSLGKFNDVFEADIPFAAFDATDIVAVETGPLRKLFLGIAARFA
jgi:hypothetical protein